MFFAFVFFVCISNIIFNFVSCNNQEIIGGWCFCAHMSTKTTIFMPCIISTHLYQALQGLSGLEDYNLWYANDRSRHLDDNFITWNDDVKVGDDVDHVYRPS